MIRDGNETELLQARGRFLCPSVGCAREAPDRCFIAETDGDSVTFRRLDARTGETGKPIHVTEQSATYIEMSPDGRNVVVPAPSSQTNVIKVIDLDTGVATGYPTENIEPGGVAWTNEPGTWLVAGFDGKADKSRNAVIATVSSQRSVKILRRFAQGLQPRNPSLSPDGKTISITMPRKESNIWVMEGL